MIVVPNADELIEAGEGVVGVAAYTANWDRYIDGQPWETLYEEVSGWPEIPVDLDPVARASGFRVLPIRKFPKGGCSDQSDHICADYRLSVYRVSGIDGDSPLPVDDPSSVIGQFALWADRIEAP